MAALLAVMSLLVHSPTHAHFPWIVVDDERHPRLFFGEGLTDQDYHLPEAIAAAEVWHTGLDAPRRKVEVSDHEEDDFIGLRAGEPIELRGCLSTAVVYGN
ncbi:MAG: hypothetical protein AAF596_01360, partial [Planctomycetota bacterium]